MTTFKLQVTISLLFVTLTMMAAGIAQAQTADGDHYLRLPSNYPQQATQQPVIIGNSRTFTGQGMGQGQLQPVQPQQPTLNAPAASSRMLPSDMGAVAPMPAMQQPAMQTAAPAQPRMMPASQTMAMSATAAPGSTMTDIGDQTNVQLGPNCGTPQNHRQHKGMNTSTTVGNDCFD